MWVGVTLGGQVCIAPFSTFDIHTAHGHEVHAQSRVGDIEKNLSKNKKIFLNVPNSALN